MISSIGRVIGTDSRSSDVISSEVEYLSSTLSLLRDSNEITNDEFLEAGSIQGGLNVLSAMISNGAEESEIGLQIRSLKERANSICERHPGLDAKIESRR
tara:strand:+ start:396 stop:695 length:300 start_codon:yes stop_codon:yes gene_type:complete